MNRRGAFTAPAAALLLLLAGCAAVPRGPVPGLAGRLSVQVEALGEQPARSFSAAFELQGTAERGELQLTSPLGSLVARAQWRPGVARLQTSQGTHSFPDLESLSVEMLGEPLPLTALVDWLHGRPWAGAPNKPVPGGFSQLGWQVDLSRFDHGALQARRPDAPAVTVRARLEQ